MFEMGTLFWLCILFNLGFTDWIFSVKIYFYRGDKLIKVAMAKTVDVLPLAVYSFLAFRQKAALAKSSTLYIAKCYYNVRINKSIQKCAKINANLLKIQNPLNTEHAKYNMFTVTCAN